jgi:hypothetical protein
MSTEIQKSKGQSVALQLNQSVAMVVSAEQMSGFEKAYRIADAIGQLKSLLTDEYMKPIMALQGTALGFKTDKDKANGYDIGVVKNCVIEAVLNGVQPTGNHFNIIAGNCYITKEGFKYKLDNMAGLSYRIVLSLPKVNQDKTGAAVEADVTWTYHGVSDNEKVPIAVKMDSYTTVDSINGKATRKARAWLFSQITGKEVPEGDATDAQILSSPGESKAIRIEGSVNERLTAK